MISAGIFLVFFTATSAAARIPQRQNLEAKLGLCDDLNRHFNLWEKCCKTYWTTVTVTSTLTRPYLVTTTKWDYITTTTTATRIIPKTTTKTKTKTESTVKTIPATTRTETEVVTETRPGTTTHTDTVARTETDVRTTTTTKTDTTTAFTTTTDTATAAASIKPSPTGPCTRLIDFNDFGLPDSSVGAPPEKVWDLTFNDFDLFSPHNIPPPPSPPVYIGPIGQRQYRILSNSDFTLLSSGIYCEPASSCKVRIIAYAIDQETLMGSLGEERWGILPFVDGRGYKIGGKFADIGLVVFDAKGNLYLDNIQVVSEAAYEPECCG